MGYYDQVADIVLQGPGIKKRAQSKNLFQDGTFSAAMNVIMDADGSLRSRPPIYTVPNKYTGIATPPAASTGWFGGSGKIIGTLKEYIIMKGNRNLVASNTQRTIGLLFTPAAITPVAEFGVNQFYTSVEAVVPFNGKVYAVVVKHYTDGTDFWFSTWVYTINNVDASIDNIVAWTGAMPRVKVGLEGKFRYSASTLDAGYFVDAFMFKQRMWVVNDNTIYFSKSLDPTVWAAPDGGFVRFPDENIKHVVPFKDILYVFCDSAIYYFTYNNDPNDSNDARLVQITNELGADYAVVHSNAIYFLKNDYIYTVTNANVERVMEFGIDDTLTPLVSTFADQSRYKMVSYKNHIYFIRQVQDLSSSAAGYPFKLDVSYAAYFGYPRVFALNMDTGFLSEIDYKDGYSTTSLLVGVFDGNPLLYNEGSRIIDAHVNQFEADGNNSQVLYFVTAGAVQVSAGDTSYSSRACSVAYMEYRELFDETAMDYADRRPYAAGYSMLYHRILPEFRLTVSNFAPDASMLFVKKFKSLLIEGNMPQKTDVEPNDYALTVHPAYDSNGYLAGAQSYVYDQASRDLYAGRVGLNQKARRISLDFFRNRYLVGTSGLFSPDFSSNTYLIRLFRLAIVWQATKRGPKYRTNPTLDANNTLN